MCGLAQPEHKPCYFIIYRLHVDHVMVYAFIAWLIYIPTTFMNGNDYAKLGRVQLKVWLSWERDLVDTFMGLDKKHTGAWPDQRSISN